jgi:uncharacterized protein
VTEVPIGNAVLELARAQSSLSAARVLLETQHYPDAVSRAYYTVFHSACALLASIGRTARSHDGVRALVSEHFIRPGLLAKEHGRTFSRMAGDRGDADYNVAALFSEADVREDVTLAESFLRAVETVLQAPTAS